MEHRVKAKGERLKDKGYGADAPGDGSKLIVDR
jgi:hypothetical protein